MKAFQILGFFVWIVGITLIVLDQLYAAVFILGGGTIVTLIMQWQESKKKSIDN
ncbi:hypothetical protein [Thalassotalea crassostreae]|uniref:hypothetical protein n=1 Tax=Thalassotalea crassostreae TaxID=1763536 RepID=UPI0012FDE7E3|nr:hypothetical protein [Thalassotalea crassostreae]